MMNMYICCSQICGVSILRAGETMEQALCEVCKDIRLGKILIQTNLDTGEPEVGISHPMYSSTVVLIFISALNCVVCCGVQCYVQAINAHVNLQ